MHSAAVWQHISNSNIKIVHNSIGHFLWNLPDFYSDDVLSCLWIVFTNSVFQVPPQKIVRRVEILGIGWPGVIGLTQNESVPWEVMPELFKCSVREMRWRLISRTEQNTWIPQAKLPMGQTHFTSNHDLPRSQPAWLFSEGVSERQSLWKQSTDKKRQLSEEKSDWFHKKYSIEL